MDNPDPSPGYPALGALRSQPRVTTHRFLRQPWGTECVDARYPGKYSSSWGSLQLTPFFRMSWHLSQGSNDLQLTMDTHSRPGYRDGQHLPSVWAPSRYLCMLWLMTMSTRMKFFKPIRMTVGSGYSLPLLRCSEASMSAGSRKQILYGSAIIYLSIVRQNSGYTLHLYYPRNVLIHTAMSQKLARSVADFEVHRNTTVV